MLPIATNFIAWGANNRPAYPMTPRYITIHNTGNTGVRANAQSHANYLHSQTAKDLPVSWHYTVDDHSIIQHLPCTESAYHATDGSGLGNRASIGIEICVNQDGEYAKAEAIAIELIRWLMGKYGIPIENVVPHQKWYPEKYCPYKILPRWASFISSIRNGVATPAHAPQITWTPAPAITTKTAYKNHTFASGDTFWSLSIKYKTTIDAIKKANPTVNPYAIRVGTIIKIPYTVTVYPVLQKGHQGESVKALQSKLIAKGYLPAGSADGSFGQGTYDAVVKFQKAKFLAADGIVGTSSWNALNK